MSRELIIKLRDDLDPSQDADETVELTIDGVEYTIDLTTEHASELREYLAPYLHAAHEKTRQKRGGTSAEERETNRRIRRWAARNGYKINAIGQIPAEIREAYAAFIPSNGTTTKPKTRAKTEPVTEYRQRAGATAKASAIESKELRETIREWARNNGFEVAARGFLSHEIREAYAAAHELNGAMV